MKTSWSMHEDMINGRLHTTWMFYIEECEMSNRISSWSVHQEMSEEYQLWFRGEKQHSSYLNLKEAQKMAELYTMQDMMGLKQHQAYLMNE